MRRRGMIIFLVMNILVSVSVAFLVISLLSSDDTEPTERLVTFQVIITATTDPFVTPFVTVVTATPLPGQPERATIPEDVLEGTAIVQAPVPTLDPALLDESGRFAGSADQLPEGCIEHTLAEGEFPSLIAEQYGANLFELLAINNLDEETSVNLQIGDVLIVPLENCPVELFLSPTEPADDEETEEPSDATPGAATVDEDEGDSADNDSEETAEVTDEVTATPSPSPSPTPTETPTITPTPTETPIPTVTLAPTASNAQVEIVEVIGAGDITREAVVIRNNGNTIDISGWTLSDADGNSYIIPDGRRLFSEGVVTINTRAGENTAILFFWGRDEAVFNTDRESGEVIVLADRNGQVQASIRLPNTGA